MGKVRGGEEKAEAEAKIVEETGAEMEMDESWRGKGRQSWRWR